MIGLVVSTVLSVALARYLARREKASPTAPPGPAQGERLALHEAIVGRLDGADYRPGPGAEPLPTVVLLHGEGDDPARAREALPPSRPLRVVTLVGRLDDGQGRRRYVDPLLQGESLRKALLREADDLTLAIVAATQRYPVDGPLVIVGAGTLGAVALAQALRGPAWFRAAFGAGGTMSADWVPGSPAPKDPPRLWKLSYGDAVGFDALAVKKAQSLGWPFDLDQGDVDVVGMTPDAATIRAWLASHWAQVGLAP